MDYSAIFHPYMLSGRQPLSRKKIVFRLYAAADDLARVSICYFRRAEPEKIDEQPLTLYAQDWARADWRGVVDFPEDPCHYYQYVFLLQDQKGLRRYYSEYGFTEDMPKDGFFEILQITAGDLPTAPDWARGVIYYQIFPERFENGGVPKSHELEPWTAEPTRENYLGGDLKGIISRLPYLKELGIGCVYLNPIFKADFNHKYATIDYYSVDPDFGTEQDLCDLVKKAHACGIRVILDGVFNHVGIHHPAFEDVLKNGSASRYADWFYLKKDSISVDADSYECFGDYPYMPRLRTDHPEVQGMILDVTRYWLRVAGIDGWRLDVADELDLSCLRLMRIHLRREFPKALLMGETWRDATRMLNEGDQTDCVMNYHFKDAMTEYFAHHNLDEKAFANRLDHMRMKYSEETLHYMYNLIGCHDTPRFLTECGGKKQMLKLAIAFQMAFPGSPAIYYGDESGMAGENDPGCRGGMNWDSMDKKLLAWTKRWIAERGKHPALQMGSFRWLCVDPAKHLLAFERTLPEETVQIAFNLDTQSHRIQGLAAPATLPAESVKIFVR